MTTFAERSDEMCNSEISGDEYDETDENEDYDYGGCGIPGCDCMTYDRYGDNDEEEGWI